MIFRSHYKSTHKNSFPTFLEKTARCPKKCGHLAVERRCPYNLSYIIFLAIGRQKPLSKNQQSKMSAIFEISYYFQY